MQARTCLVVMVAAGLGNQGCGARRIYMPARSSYGSYSSLTLASDTSPLGQDARPPSPSPPSFLSSLALAWLPGA